MTLRYLSRAARFSADGRYRFWLEREWHAERGRVAFIGVNPSTADGTLDDPTIKKCVAFAVANGGGELRMVNLFALCSTDPRELLKTPEPIGTANDEHLLDAVRGAELVVCAWGSKPGPLGRLVRARAAEVLKLLRGTPLHCLRKTRDGSPEHPLFLPANLRPIPYEAP